jgi:hypothetical protein
MDMSMQLEEINEPISVIALYETGGVRPYRLKWRDRVYHVTVVLHRWRERVGHRHRFHLTINTNMATWMELTIDSEDLSWRLVRTGTEG